MHSLHMDIRFKCQATGKTAARSRAGRWQTGQRRLCCQSARSSSGQRAGKTGRRASRCGETAGTTGGDCRAVSCCHRSPPNQRRPTGRLFYLSNVPSQSTVRPIHSLAVINFYIFGTPKYFINFLYIKFTNLRNT